MYTTPILIALSSFLALTTTSPTSLDKRQTSSLSEGNTIFLQTYGSASASCSDMQGALAGVSDDSGPHGKDPVTPTYLKNANGYTMRLTTNGGRLGFDVLKSFATDLAMGLGLNGAGCKIPSGGDNSILDQDIAAIKSVLQTYEKALNTADAPLAVSLYTSDGVVMPQHSPSGIGTAAITIAYNSFFDIIKFSVKFDIQEIVPTAPDWAFARTNSAGTTDVKGRGVGNEANQELFVFQKVGGEWRIARYCFSTTNPPPK